MSADIPTLNSYSLEMETGDAGKVRFLCGDVPLVLSPSLLALASEAECAFIRYDEHLETSPYRECVGLFQKRREAFALAALCGSDLPFLHFVAPESNWPRGEDAAKANARKYIDIIDKYHHPAWAAKTRLDRSVLSMIHFDLTESPQKAWDAGWVSDADPVDSARYPVVPYRTEALGSALPASEIGQYMKDLQSFAVKPWYLTQMQSCLSHLQLHYISPFSSINGPVGTLYSYLIYAKRSFSKNAFVSVAATTMDRVDNPLDAYKARGEGAVEPYGLWVYHAAKSLLRQVETLKAFEARFAQIHEEWMRSLSARRVSPVCLQLATDLLSLPAVDSALVQQRYGRTAPAANAILQTLVDHGLIQPANSNKRYRFFCSQAVIDIYYDAFSTMLPKGWLATDFKKLDFE